MMMEWHLIARLCVALLLGAAIGFERQWRQRGAGLRTNALVALGAAAFVTLPGLLGDEQSPTRMAAQVVSGIGFLGGGVILREGLNVCGLNTAATLWCSGAAGTLAGSGFLTAATLAASLVVAANVLLRPIGQLINRQPLESSEVEITYQLNATCVDREEPHIRTLLLQAVAREALLLKALRSEDLPDGNLVRVEAEVITTGRSDQAIEEIMTRLSMEPGTKTISWEIVGSEGKEAAV